MHIYMLTSIGDSLASNPEDNPSEAKRILYWMRRNGNKCTDEQIESYVIPDRGHMQMALRKLTSAGAIKRVG